MLNQRRGDRSDRLCRATALLHKHDWEAVLQRREHRAESTRAALDHQLYPGYSKLLTDALLRRGA
eukprot:1133428-Pleurochrysis_carterae.AAC.2